MKLGPYARKLLAKYGQSIDRLAMSRGPSHIRIIAIGSAGQNISGNPTRGAIGGV
jgi:hypothetical protein